MAVFLAGADPAMLGGMTERDMALRADVYMAQLAVDRLEHAWPDPAVRTVEQDRQLAGALDRLRICRQIAADSGLEPWRSADRIPPSPASQ